ncbi:hypothetical protein Goshw_006589, partial [Gossypium schwendimanii]|nr:hypothetical protein [Gossypium schwendimanii]
MYCGYSPSHPSASLGWIIWARTSNGIFSLKSVYWHIRERSWKSKDVQWNTPWKFQGLERVRFFLWLILNQKLLTNVEHVKRGIRHDSSRGLCGYHLKIFCKLSETVQFASFHSDDVSRRNEQISVAQVLESCISLCTDRAVQIVSGNATARGVIRNGNGEWIMGYDRYLGKCSIFDAELWGILDGLALFQYRRYDDVMIQTDSLE